MRPLTANRPKVLLPVAGTPLLVRLIRQFAAAGVVDLTVVVHYHGDRVREAVGDGASLGVRVRYVEQGAPRGTGHAAAAGARAAEVGREPFLVANGDLLLDDADVRAVVEAARATPIVTAARVEDASAYGVFRLDAHGHPISIEEKSAKPPSALANAGVYGFPGGFLDRLTRLTDSPRGELEITDAVTAAMREGTEFRLVELASWMDVGRPWDLLLATERALRTLAPQIEGKVEPGAHLHGPVHVGEGTVVRSGAYIEGPVWIGRGCTIGPNCHIRPNTAIGDGCKVGNAVEVKASVLMAGTHVGHLSYVGDSVLGERVNFGAGTKVANLRHDGKTIKVEFKGERVDTKRRKMGVIVGDDVHTGINTSLNVGVVLDSGGATAPGEVVMRSR